MMSDPLWALAGVALGGIIGGLTSYCLQKKQFEHNKEMYLIKNQSKEVVKELLTDMLNHKDFTDRSFDVLKKPIGGYTDDQVKQLLHEIKAKKVKGKNGKELWYLLNRQEERQG